MLRIPSNLREMILVLDNGFGARIVNEKSLPIHNFEGKRSHKN